MNDFKSLRGVCKALESALNRFLGEPLHLDNPGVFTWLQERRDYLKALVALGELLTDRDRGTEDVISKVDGNNLSEEARAKFVVLKERVNKY